MGPQSLGKSYDYDNGRCVTSIHGFNDMARRGSNHFGWPACRMNYLLPIMATVLVARANDRLVVLLVTANLYSKAFLRRQHLSLYRICPRGTSLCTIPTFSWS